MKSGKRGVAQYSKAVKRRLEDDVKDVVEGSRKVLSSRAQAQLEMLIDCSVGRLAPFIDPLSGQHGRIGMSRHKVEGDIVVSGTNKFGMLVFSPYSGPVYDRACVRWSNSSSFAEASSTSISNVYTGVITGVTDSGWSRAPFSAATSPVEDDVQFRPAAFIIRLTKTGTSTQQDGSVYMLEEPSHANLTMTWSELKSHNRTNTISATSDMGPKEILALNWHPKGNGAGDPGDFAFHKIVGGATSGLSSGNVTHAIMFASPGGFASWHFEIFGVYYLTGERVDTGFDVVQDSRGWDLISNGLRRKLSSGWVGTPADAEHSYLTSIVHVGKELVSYLPSVASSALKAAEAIGGFVL